jgi:ATP-dependent Clp protease ATP-binding subunit ClpB
MFSDILREALLSEVVGQPHAVNSVVRGVTRLVSGLMPPERSWCAYLFMGPPGTGRAHIVRTLARILHGDETVFTLNCNPGVHPDPWLWFVQQLTPLFAVPETRAHARTPRILLIQDLECARKEFHPMLARLLETGRVVLPDGRLGRLDDSMIFLTTGLCTREILDEASGIGFSGASLKEVDQHEKDAIVKTCRAEAESAFGLELLAQLDNLVVFRKLEDKHLASVLERHFARMSRWLALRGIECTLTPAAHAFLLERGRSQTLLGARNLLLAHRREVEFPMADLLVSRQLEGGVRVTVDRRPDDDHLHFTVIAGDGLRAGTAPKQDMRSDMREVPVG